MRSGAAAAAPAGGTRLAGRYLLLDRLGSGGMGVVWRARDELLGREVAIKDLWLPPSATAAERTRLRDRVLGEARVAARFSHPGAVVLHDVLVHDGRPLLVMELVDAPTLHELVEREGPLPPGLVARLGLRLLDTLAAAHRQGVVHLDVTPANVLVLADGGAKLADFGIAAAQDAPAREGGTVLGSPAYMAPEQIASERVGPAADLWALAATMYFAVEGVPPFGLGEPRETLAAVVADPPRPPRLAGPLGPALLSELAKQPAQRPGAKRLRQLLAPLADGHADRPVGGDRATSQGDAVARRRHAAAARRASGHHQAAPDPAPLARRARAHVARPGHCLTAAARPGRHAGTRPLAASAGGRHDPVAGQHRPGPSRRRGATGRQPGGSPPLRVRRRRRQLDPAGLPDR